MRSLSASILGLPGACPGGLLCRHEFGQRGLPGRRHRALATLDRADRRRLPGSECIEQRFGRGSIEILIKIVIDLEDRRVDAGAEALHLDQRELSVRTGMTGRDPELLLAGREDL